MIRSTLERLGIASGEYELRTLYELAYSIGREDMFDAHLRLLYFSLIRAGWPPPRALAGAKESVNFFNENSGCLPSAKVPKVIVETPFAGGRERNRHYLLAALRDCVNRGESPYASHVILPLVLDDDNPRERAKGIALGFAWRANADATVVYDDLGISSGMQQGIEHARVIGSPVVHRKLGGEWA